MPGTAKRKRGTTLTPEPSKKPKEICHDSSERITFDRDGDVILKVQSVEHDGQSKTEFLVSSKALSLGSPVFNAMLNGRFVEAAEPGIGIRTASLQDDDPQALMLLCNIVHLRFSLLPKQISLDELFNIAVVSDKYDMVSKVKPFIKHHCNFHRKDMTKPGNEVYFFIAWALGQVKDFKKMFMHLAFAISLPASTSRDSSRTLNSTGEKDAHDNDDVVAGVSALFALPVDVRQDSLNKLSILNCENEDFSADLPLNAKAALLILRNDIFITIRSLCSIYWHRLQGRMMGYATPDHGQYECYAMEFGHLSHLLSKWNLHPHSPDIDVNISIRSLVTLLFEYKPLRCIGCKVPNGSCRSEADYKDFRAGLQELDTFKTNEQPEVISLLKQVELRDES